MLNRIFSVDSPKAIKASSYGYLNAIHYMAPAGVAGVGNLCPHASAGCKALCLGLTSGQAGMVKDIDSDQDQGNSVRASRKAKAVRFMRQRHGYMRDVVRSINNLVAKARRENLMLCVRMNGSTDIAWESIRDAKGKTVFDLFPDVQFVDYTKNPRRMTRQLPANYHLTFSRSETNEAVAETLLDLGHNVAVVFAKAKPHTWRGYTVVDGDTHDLRHLDPKAGSITNGHSMSLGGYVIGLSPKGRKAKADTSGFVVR
jgi:hypothetical protein